MKTKHNIAVCNWELREKGLLVFCWSKQCMFSKYGYELWFCFCVTQKHSDKSSSGDTFQIHVSFTNTLSPANLRNNKGRGPSFKVNFREILTGVALKSRKVILPYCLARLPPIFLSSLCQVLIGNWNCFSNCFFLRSLSSFAQWLHLLGIDLLPKWRD